MDICLLPELALHAIFNYLSVSEVRVFICDDYDDYWYKRFHPVNIPRADMFEYINIRSFHPVLIKKLARINSDAFDVCLENLKKIPNFIPAFKIFASIHEDTLDKVLDVMIRREDLAILAIKNNSKELYQKTLANVISKCLLHGYHKVLQALIDKGYDTSILDPRSMDYYKDFCNHPLAYCAKFIHWNNILDANGNTWLQKYLLQRYDAVCSVILRFGIDAAHVNDDGYTALMIACSRDIDTIDEYDTEADCYDWCVNYDRYNDRERIIQRVKKSRISAEKVALEILDYECNPLHIYNRTNAYILALQTGMTEVTNKLFNIYGTECLRGVSSRF